jgi:hypothetical protein
MGTETLSKLRSEALSLSEAERAELAHDLACAQLRPSSGVGCSALLGTTYPPSQPSSHTRGSCGSSQSSRSNGCS